MNVAVIAVVIYVMKASATTSRYAGVVTTAAIKRKDRMTSAQILRFEGWDLVIMFVRIKESENVRKYH